MKVTLEHITPNAEEFIGRMAAICYDANLDPAACTRRAAKCSRDGHLATLRFASAVFHIEGISRVCSHQFVRSKHLDFLQRSQRYCKEVDTEFVTPDNAFAYDYQRHYQHCLALYHSLIKEGVKKEDARFVLPEATHTEMNVVGNLQAWMDFIKLRDDPHAQWEIRNVARTINNILAEHCPNIFFWRPPHED
jgi:thymidylate synthase (FAD)